LIIGLLVSVIQAVTQINEATLSFLPKVGVVVLVFFLLGPFFVEVMNIFSVRIFDHIVTVGGT
jgi:flagellar biosynthetic protein FliQ